MTMCALTFYPVVVCGLIFCAVIGALHMEPFLTFFSSMASALLVIYLVRSYRFEQSKYAVSEDGVRFQTGRQKPIVKTYDEIPQISVLIYSGTASLNDYRVGICFHLSEIPEEAVFLRRITRSYFYPINHIRQFQIVDYNEQLYLELKKRLPSKVVDYREKQLSSI